MQFINLKRTAKLIRNLLKSIVYSPFYICYIILIVLQSDYQHLNTTTLNAQFFPPVF
jgi:hypothetical protein